MSNQAHSGQVTRVRDPRRNRWKAAIGVFVSVAIAAVAAWVLFQTFQRISLADVVRSMQSVPVERVLLAGVCVVALYILLPAFEIAAVRYVKDYRGLGRPVVTALVACPLGHAIGGALLSAGAIRYRMYRPAGFSAIEIGATILMCTLPAVLAFGWLIDLALIFGAGRLAPVFHLPEAWLVAAGVVGLIKDVGYLLLVRLRKAPVRLGGWAVNLPTPGMTVLQTVVGIIDLLLVTCVLYVLMPPSMALGFLPFLAVYLASMMAGILSHVPAGFGVLESVLLVLLPQVPADELLAAVLLYRVIYEVIPLLMALGVWAGWELLAPEGARLRFSEASRRSSAG